MTDLIRVSSSEIDTYRQCRLKHQLQYLERWRTDDEQEALARGTLYHSVMEAHYRAIGELESHVFNSQIAEDLFLAVAPLLYEEGTGAQTERQELVEWIYRGYVQCYGLDTDWEIVGIEVPLNEPLLYRDGSPSRFLLSGTCDLIVRDHAAQGGLWIVDHKTCKDLPKKDFDLEDQTAVYAWLLKRAGYDIRGAIYNHCRTYKLKTRPMEHDERFLRQHTVRTDFELAECAYEVLELMDEAYDRVLTMTCPVCNGHGEAQGDGSGWDGASMHTPACENCGGSLVVPRDAPRSPDGERCGWKCNLTEACIAGRKYGPDRTRSFLEDTGFTIHETKPGPTFNKKRGEPVKTDA